MNKIRKIEVDTETDDVTFYFEGSSEPFHQSEFDPDSFTRRHLSNIVYEIEDFNSEVELNDRTDS